MKLNYKTLLYDKWSEFKNDVIQDISKADVFPYGKYIFRGQENADWKLVASFDRCYEKLSFDERRILQNGFLEDFKILCAEWSMNNKFDQYNTLQIMSIGQHYGLPTRLLDWTFSIYIAAFFAFSNIESNASSVAIWVLDQSHEIWKGEYGVTIETVSVVENDRQKYQNGVFTLNKSPEMAIEDYVDSCARNHIIDGALYKVVIPVSQRRIVLNDLDMMGINFFNLYRGIDGCARAAVLKQFLKNDFD